MRRWQCHKIVEAEKILSLEYTRERGFWLMLDSGEEIEISNEWLLRHEPKRELSLQQLSQLGELVSGIPGGYFVRYAAEDGKPQYASWSPATPFEAGYTPL